jgi:hypothetical protein
MQPSQVEKIIDQFDFTIHSLILLRNQMANEIGETFITINLVKEDIFIVKPNVKYPNAAPVNKVKQNYDEEPCYTLTKKEARKFIENFCSQSETFLPTHDRGPMYQCVRYIEQSMTKSARNMILSKVYNSLPKDRHQCLRQGFLDE